MISRDVQTRLANRYIGPTGVTKVAKAFASVDRSRDRARIMTKVGSIQENIQANQEMFEVGTEARSAVVFVDIASFSTKIANLSARQVRDYLDAFYATAIPIIYEHNGVIDRIAGDGIIAVYSEFFEPSMTLATAEDLAFKTAECVVKALIGGSYESKGALAAGRLLFCKTGLADFYEDLTVVGHPMTEVYRLEGAASANQVVVLEGTRTAQKIQADVDRREKEQAEGKKLGPVRWIVSSLKRELQGMGEVTIVQETYRK